MYRALYLCLLFLQIFGFGRCQGKQELALAATQAAERAVKAVGKSVQALKEIASIGWLYGRSSPAQLADSTATRVTQAMREAASMTIDLSSTPEQIAGMAFVKTRTAVQQAGLAAEAAVKANEHMENIANIWAMEAKNALREAAAAGKQTEQALKLVIPQGSGGGQGAGGHIGGQSGSSAFSVPGASQVGAPRAAVQQGQAAAQTNQAASINQGSFFSAMQKILRQQYQQQLQQQQARNQQQQQTSHQPQPNNLSALQTLLSQLALFQKAPAASAASEPTRGFFSD